MLSNQIIEHFNIEGQIKDISPIDGGSINHTFLVQTELGDETHNYLAQKVNTDIFNQPDSIGKNIQIIQQYLSQQDYIYNTLDLVPTKNENLGFHENEQMYWRMFDYIDHSTSFSVAKTTEMSYDVALAFGDFTNKIQGTPTTQVHTAIPDFHNLKKRIIDFKKSIKKDAVQRLKYCQKEVNYLNDHIYLVEQFINLNLPTRLVHADAKIGNVLFDKSTKKVKAIIDWDTIMPSSILFDFGDLIRSMACSHDENEEDISKIHFNTNYLSAIKSGFCKHWSDRLVKVEHDHLVLSAKVLILIQAIRFLTDFLNGDSYYQIQYPTHNWRRAQNQIALAQSFIQQIPN